MNKTALFSLSYGLYLASVEYNGKLNGCIINTAVQVCDTPVKIAITISKNNLTNELIQQKMSFTLSVLDIETTMETISNFGFVSGREKEKFDNVPYYIDKKNNPYLKDNNIAFFSCDVEKIVDIDTHTMFICNVVEAEKLSDNEPLTYKYYHAVKKGTTPKNAPSYMEESAKKGYKCTVCQYIYEGDTLPSDFICPICKKDASFFQKI